MFLYMNIMMIYLIYFYRLGTLDNMDDDEGDNDEMIDTDHQNNSSLYSNSTLISCRKSMSE